jgi:hypothetical protein
VLLSHSGRQKYIIASVYQTILGVAKQNIVGIRQEKHNILCQKKRLKKSLKNFKKVLKNA